jgi:hypothetical protein
LATASSSDGALPLDTDSLFTNDEGGMRSLLVEGPGEMGLGRVCLCCFVSFAYCHGLCLLEVRARLHFVYLVCGFRSIFCGDY